MSQRLGLRVGVLDADVHGPSLPRLLNLPGRPAVDAGGSHDHRDLGPPSAEAGALAVLRAPPASLPASAPAAQPPRPPVPADEMMVPLMGHGLKAISMGNLMYPAAAPRPPRTYQQPRRPCAC